MYWEAVLKEVLNKETEQKFLFTNLGTALKKIKETANEYRVKKPKPKNYSLGNKFNNICLSRREAQCIMYIIRGKSIKSTAQKLKLSPRTVEYYLKNIKRKLCCHSKFALIDIILESDFLTNVDFR